MQEFPRGTPCWRYASAADRNGENCSFQRELFFGKGRRLLLSGARIRATFPQLKWNWPAFTVLQIARAAGIPFLAVRGSADVVGVKRDARWTEFACNSAGAFLQAFSPNSPYRAQVGFEKGTGTGAGEGRILHPISVNGTGNTVVVGNRNVISKRRV